MKGKFEIEKRLTHSLRFPLLQKLGFTGFFFAKTIETIALLFALKAGSDL